MKGVSLFSMNVARYEMTMYVEIRKLLSVYHQQFYLKSAAIGFR
uniref:Uncharacterized protein n=1 Tax=Methylophaga nitratireducenticrescens TaxID=754476 RepID=I1XEX1_METNJ